MDPTAYSFEKTNFAASAGTHYAAAAAAVTEPLMSSIGGGGFALVRSPDGAALIDYYDCMPGKGLPASAFGAGGRPTTVILKYGAGVKSIVGAASCAVPGSLRGWELLLKRHGRFTLRETLVPAVRLAREGFRLCKTSGMWCEVAEEVLRLTDEAIVRKPLSFAYSGSTVHTNGPPSAGGPTLAQMARVISAYDLAGLPAADYAKILAGAMKYALEDRERAYTEIAENARVAERMMGEEYVRAQRARILGTV